MTVETENKQSSRRRQNKGRDTDESPKKENAAAESAAPATEVQREKRTYINFSPDQVGQEKTGIITYVNRPFGYISEGTEKVEGVPSIRFLFKDINDRIRAPLKGCVVNFTIGKDDKDRLHAENVTLTPESRAAALAKAEAIAASKAEAKAKVEVKVKVEAKTERKPKAEGKAKAEGKTKVDAKAEAKAKAVAAAAAASATPEKKSRKRTPKKAENEENPAAEKPAKRERAPKKEKAPRAEKPAKVENAADPAPKQKSERKRKPFEDLMVTVKIEGSDDSKQFTYSGKRNIPYLKKLSCEATNADTGSNLGLYLITEKRPDGMFMNPTLFYRAKRELSVKLAPFRSNEKKRDE